MSDAKRDDDDLTTPEWLLHTEPGDSLRFGLVPIGGGPGELVHGALDRIMADFKRPAYRAGFGVSILMAALLAGKGVRLGPAVFISMMAGAGAERLYEMAEDIHAGVSVIARAVVADSELPERLDSDAPGEV